MRRQTPIFWIACCFAGIAVAIVWEASANRDVRVESVARLSSVEIPVYNIRVEGHENYYVSQLGLLVHNCSLSGAPDSTFVGSGFYSSNPRPMEQLGRAYYSPPDSLGFATVPRPARVRGIKTSTLSYDPHYFVRFNERLAQIKGMPGPAQLAEHVIRKGTPYVSTTEQSLTYFVRAEEVLPKGALGPNRYVAVAVKPGVGPEGRNLVTTVMDKANPAILTQHYEPIPAGMDPLQHFRSKYPSANGNGF